VSEVNDLLENIPLYPQLTQFIKSHASQYKVATGNLRCWVEKLSHRIGCEVFTSDGDVVDNKVKKLTSILKKEIIVRQFKEAGQRVVFIGDGNNDVEAMRDADISIACGMTHYPAKSVLTVANYLVFEESALCRQLTQLC
jgi:phosphoserine phosphatase